MSPRLLLFLSVSLILRGAQVTVSTPLGQVRSVAVDPRGYIYVAGTDPVPGSPPNGCEHRPRNAIPGCDRPGLLRCLVRPANHGHGNQIGRVELLDPRKARAVDVSGKVQLR